MPTNHWRTLALACVMAAPASVLAQGVDNTGSGNITAGTGTASQVQVSTVGTNSADFTVTGTWTATLVAEVTEDGTNWVAVPVIQKISDDTFAANTTANGTFRFEVGGSKLARVRASAFTSGTAVVTIRATRAGPGQAFKRGTDGTVVVSGSVTVGTFPDNEPVNVAQWGATATTLGQKAMTASVPVVVSSDQSALSVDTTSADQVTALISQTGTANDVDVLTFPDNEPISVAQIAGTATATGNGVVGAGVQRVAIASDNTAFTVNAAQSGTWNVTNISGTVSLPTGASTLAEQQTQTTSLQLADDVVHSGAAAISKYTAVGAQLDDTTPTTPAEDQVAAMRMTSARALHVQAQANSGVDIGDVTINNAAGAAAVNIQDGGNSLTVDGTITANAGTGTFTVGDGTGPLTVDGTITANAGTGVFDVTPVSPAATDYLPTRPGDGADFFAGFDQDSGAGTSKSLSVTWRKSGSLAPEFGTATDPVRTDPTGTTTQPVSGTVTSNAGTGVFDVTPATPGATDYLPARVTDGTAFIPFPTALSAGGGLKVGLSDALPAGTANIGDVDVLSFPDNEPINVAQINGVAVTMGNGISGTGVQRVTLASDSTGQVTLAAGSATVGTVNVGTFPDNEPVDVTPAAPVATDYLPARLTDGTGFLPLPTALTGSGNFKVAVLEAIPTGSNAIGSVSQTAGWKGAAACTVDAGATAQAADFAVYAATTNRRLCSLTLRESAGTPAVATAVVRHAALGVDCNTGNPIEFIELAADNSKSFEFSERGLAVGSGICVDVLAGTVDFGSSSITEASP